MTWGSRNRRAELRETHFTALLCNLKSQKHFWESKPFIIHTAFLARWVLMLMALRNHSVICRSVTSFLEACCNLKKFSRFEEMPKRSRDAEHFSMAGRHCAVSSPNCSFAFNTFRNFLKKVDSNSFMNSVPLEMLIYQNSVLVYSELSVAFLSPRFLSLSHLQNYCVWRRKEQSKLCREDGLLSAEQPPHFYVNKVACVNITWLLHFFLHLTKFYLELCHRFSNMTWNESYNF